MKNSNKPANIIWACVIFVIGLLFCFSLSYGVKGLSYIIGIAIILTGVVLTLDTISKKSSTLTIMSLFSAFLIAFGIVFIAKELADIIIAMIPWILIAVGVLIFVDAFLLYCVRKSKTNLKFIVELILGTVLFVFGLIVKFAKNWDTYSALVLGIAFIVYAIYLLLCEISSNK